MSSALSNFLPHDFTNYQNQNIKRQKLIAFAQSVLQNPLYREELSSLMKVLKVDLKEVLETYVKYNLDIYAIGNEIYDSPAIRLILHIHNLLFGSWHQERHNTILRFFQEANPQTVADIGFGVPTRYTRHLLSMRSAFLTLCDISEHAFIFAKKLLDIWDKNWPQVIDFKKMDMETGEFIGSYDLYMFIDSIEHIMDPMTYLKKYVRLSPRYSKFILSLPIGPQVPMHYIAWFSTQEALIWLKLCNLRTVNAAEIKVNPEVDLFAEQYNYNYYNLIVLCEKEN